MIKPNYIVANKIYNEFVVKEDSDGTPFSLRYERMRKGFKEKNYEMYQRILTFRALSLYIKELLPWLIPILETDNSDIMIAEDLGTWLAIKEIINILKHDSRAHNLHFVSADIPMKNPETFTLYRTSTDRRELEEYMPMKKFNAIVGNPPYSYIGKNGKPIPSRQFWHDFSKWSFDHIKDGGLVSLITPDNWLASNTYENSTIRTKYNLVSTFPVEFADATVSARAWIVTKSEYEGVTNFDGEACDMTKLPYYPLNGKYVGIFEKIFEKSNILSLEMGSHFQSYDYGKRNDSPNDISKFPVYVSNTKIAWTENPSQCQFLKKVMVLQNSGSVWKSWYDNGHYGGSENIWYKSVENEEEGKKLETYLSSNIISFIIKTTKRRRNAISFVLKNIPVIPLNRNWTNHELYEYFNLTEIEIEMIEEVVK